MTDPDLLAAIACELAQRVRDDGPEDNGRWLAGILPDPDDRFALCFVLAAAVPDDRPWRELIAWVTEGGDQPRQLRPCGTTAAARRHRAHGEEVCPPCLEAERRDDRIRKRLRRAA